LYHGILTVLTFLILQLCKRRSLGDQSLMYSSTVAKFRWFLLPSEALKFVAVSKDNNLAGVDSIKSPRPFAPKVYSENEKSDGGQSEKATVPSCQPYPNSIPTQILQSSSWNYEPSILNSLHNHRVISELDSGMSNSISSELNFSSNEHEEDNDLFVTAGATVTGPAICFGFGSSFEEKSSSVDTEREDGVACGDSTEVTQKSIPEVNNFVMFSQQNSISSQGDQAVPNDCISTQSGNTDQQFQTSPPQLQLDSPSQGGYSSSPMSMPMTGYFPQSNMNQQGFVNNNCVFSQDSMPPSSPIPQSNYAPSSYSYQQSQSNTISETCTTYVQLNSQAVSSVEQQQQQSYQQSYCPSPSYQLQPNNSFENSYNVVDGNIGNASSPVMAFSPTPYGYNGSYFPDQNAFQQSPNLDPPTQFYQQPFSPDPYQKLASFTPSNHIENGVNEQIVEVAMRRVTDEIANQLKSEIRDVINQVEQGIDPSGSRERANSFSLKDRKLESLKRRTRTLSGHVLSSFNKTEDKPASGLSKSYEADDAVNSGEKFDTIEKEVRSTDDEVFGIEPKPKEKKCLECTPVADRVPLPQIEPPTNLSKWHCPTKQIFKPTLKASFLTSLSPASSMECTVKNCRC
jgi:hypothetical protein